MTQEVKLLKDRRPALDAGTYDEPIAEFTESCFAVHPDDDSVVCYENVRPAVAAAGFVDAAGAPAKHFGYCSAYTESHGRVWWDGGQPKAPAPQ